MSTRLTRTAAIIFSSLALIGPAHGDVTGKVTLDGKPPEMKVINMQTKECAACHADPVTEETVIVGDKGELKNVVVYLKKDPEKEMPGKPSKEPVVLDQQGCMFVPHVVAMMSGQTLVVKNSDDFPHNVDSKAKNDENKFNNGMPKANSGLRVDPQPKVEEIFQVKCDVHPWMSAYVAVFEHPYFAVTGDDGMFAIKDVPDGSYTFEAWQEKYGIQQAKVTVKDGKAVVNFTYKAK